MALDIKHTLATNLARLMADSKLTKNQSELARKSGVSQRTISNYLAPERYEGSPTLDNIELLARAFNIEAWQLLHPTAGKLPDDALKVLRSIIDQH